MNKYATALLLAAYITLSCSGARQKRSDSAGAGAPPALYTYKITGTYPHSTGDYTQGLFFHGGTLFESTGTYGDSRLKAYEPQSGRVLREQKLPEGFFGEGAAMVDSLIYVLTWQEGTAMVFDAGSFELLRKFRYRGEGWGLTTDGKLLYMSDGSARIQVLDPQNFSPVRSFEVRAGSTPVPLLNELEWIDGRIWANVYTSDVIVIIDPATGAVTGIADMRGLLPGEDRTPETDVLNGIAYDADSGRIVVTGKNWNKMFEIELIEK